MTDPATTGERLTFTDESEAVPAATITLVEGSSFAICDAGGDIDEGTVEGVFVGDTRICSRLRLTVDRQTVEPLTVAHRSPSDAVCVGRSRDRDLLVHRALRVGSGMRIELRIDNLTTLPRHAAVELVIRADLADLFAVKEGRAGGESAPWQAQGSTLRFATPDDHRGLRAVGDAGAVASPAGALCWTAELPPRGTWRSVVDLVAVRDGVDVEPATPTPRQARWEEDLPRIETDVPGLQMAFDRATRDLGGLRLLDPQYPDDAVVAAGAPWFMTLFGRDSILTSWMALLLDPSLAAATARTLARLQGRETVPETEEQPGRILHEVRFSGGASLALADGDVYYGTADATPLFVMLVHELWRWGMPAGELEPLLPAVDAALGWLAGPGDPDGDGYVEYRASAPGSLANQGWKDSFDGVSFASGALATPPIALAEVQAYAFAAWRAGAALARAAGDHVRASAREARAEALQIQFARDFWLPERQAIALALDADKRPVDAVASNMGHCLWAGIVREPEQAAAVARWLVSPELFSGWGVRTLATSMGRYSPLSYHNGSVWPHDTAICIAGLRRAGFVEEALVVAQGLLAAAQASGGRLPELFAGITDDDVPTPVPYPASCSPQAWSAASPLLVARVLLGLEPDLPNGTISVDPVLPAGATALRLVDVPLGGSRVTIEVDGESLAVRGLPKDVALVRRSR